MSGFIDTQGMIKDPGDIVTISDFKEYWENNKYDDPVLSQYNTFIDWWKDSKQWFPYAEDDEIMGSSSIYAANENNSSKLLRLINENQENLLWGDLYYFLNLALDRLDEDTVEDITNRIVSEGFFGDPATVNASTSITAADEKINPAQERADELQDRIEDDFDYVVAGVERLGREGQLDAAIEIMEKIADTLDSAIGIIGEDFVTDEDIEEL